MGQSGRALRGAKEGGDGADDVKRQVDSDDNFQRPIYQLVNVKNGGGKLIEIIKSSARRSSSSFGFTNSTELSAQRQADASVSRWLQLIVMPQRAAD